MIHASLAAAGKQPTFVRYLNLTAADDLICRNMLCEKLLDPCVCRLSRAIERLPHLTHLSLRRNRLATLPPAVLAAPMLQYLDLAENPNLGAALCSTEPINENGDVVARETGLPQGLMAAFESARTLRVLDLSGTGLVTVPPVIWQLPQLRTLLLSNNPNLSTIHPPPHLDVII